MSGRLGRLILIFFLVIGVFEIAHGDVFSTRDGNSLLDDKLEMTRRLHPRILALGESRIMPLRADSFPAGARFYNASADAAAADGLEGMLEFLESLSARELPDMVILDLGPWLFNPNYPQNRRGVRGLKKARGTLSLFYDRLSSYASLIGEPQLPGIGLDARLADAGYARDGSRRYARTSEEARAVALTPGAWSARLAMDEKFAPADRLDARPLERLRAILIFARRNRVRVVGVLLPFRNDLYEALLDTPGRRDFFRKFRKKIPSLMASFGARCFDFSSPVDLGLIADDFFDPYRPKTRVIAAIFGRVLAQLDGRLGPLHASSTPRRTGDMVVFLGDSITEFWDLPGCFAGAPINPVNRGVSGQASRQMLARFDRDVLSSGAGSVVITAGTNDIMRGIAATEVEDNLASMSWMAAAAGIGVYMGTIPPSNPEKPARREINDWIVHFCGFGSCRALLFDAALSTNDGRFNPLFFRDGMHPNEKGCLAMAAVVKNAFAADLAQKRSALRRK